MLPSVVCLEMMTQTEKVFWFKNVRTGVKNSQTAKSAEPAQTTLALRTFAAHFLQRLQLRIWGN